MGEHHTDMADVELEDLESEEEHETHAPLMVEATDAERQEIAALIKESLEIRRQRPAQDKRDWQDAVASNILLVIFLCMLIYIYNQALLQPIRTLQDWIPVKDCRVTGYRIDYISSALQFVPVEVVEVEYKATGGQAVTAYATESVVGSGGGTGFVASAVAQDVFPECYVNPRNIFVVALSKNEKVGMLPVVIMILLGLLLVLQIMALVQTIYLRKPRLCICARRRPTDLGYGLVAQNTR